MGLETPRDKSRGLFWRMALVVVVGLGLLIFTTIALTTPSTTIVRQGIVIAWSAALLAGGIYFYRLLSRLGVLARRVDEGSAELAEIRERFQKYFEIHQRLNDIIEFLPNATFVVDTERRVVAWNRAIEDMTGVRKADILGRGNFEYSLPVYGERRPILIDLAFLPDDELKLRYDFVRKERHTLFAETYVKGTYLGKGAYLMGAASLLYDPGGRVVGAIESIRDITNSKRAEAALVASEQKFNKTFHLSPALVAISEPETGRFLDVNEQFENQLGYSRSEMIGKTAGELNIWKSPEDRSAMLAALREHGRVRNLEFPIQAKSGQIVEVLFSSEIIELNGRSVLLSMANDITEHKRAQDALKTHRRRLQALASELVVAEEAERRRIAEEIHDNIGQSLSISLLKIAALRQGDLCPAAVKDSLLDIANVVEKTVGDLRTMIFDLSSPVLYKMGLEEAIEEWLSEGLGRKHKIRYGLTRENEPQPLDEKIKVLLFRAVREVLVNVLKHARASHVGVHIVWSPDRVRVAVEDNGVGFDPAEKMPLATRKGGFGLLSIRERLTYLGGSFEVHSQPSRGSRMVLTVPCRIMEFPFHGEPV